MLNSDQLQALVQPLLRLVIEAGDVILEYYSRPSSLDIHTKKDRTPLTAADLASQALLLKGIADLCPNIPILSEESQAPAFAQRKDWEELWLLDPLDGTREFIDATDQFCINIALVQQGEPVLGLIHKPVDKSTYLGIHGLGAWCYGAQGIEVLQCRAMPAQPVLISSGRRLTEPLLASEARIRTHFPALLRHHQGSAIKFCELAAGRADIYPCFGPTCEWDTAAGQVLVEAAGGIFVSTEFQPFRYNQRESLINGGFYVLGDARVDWPKVLVE